MSGKGSKQRPMTVQRDLFESNWDRIFRSDNGITVDNIELDWNKTYDPPHGPQGLPDVHKGDKGPMLREVNYDGMWQHSCTVEMAVVWIGKDETCSLCGAWEEDDVR